MITSKGESFFAHVNKHAWLLMKIYGPKLEPRSKLGHENRRALEPENSAESEHKLILRQNVAINSNEYFSCDVIFREWNRRPRGLETSLRNHQEFRDISNIYKNIRFIMVYRMIINVFFIYSSFVMTYDVNFLFLKKSFRHNGSAVFDEMPEMFDISISKNPYWLLIEVFILISYRLYR